MIGCASSPSVPAPPPTSAAPLVYVTSLRSAGPQFLATTYRQRWRAEQAIEECKNGHDLDHLVSYRLHPNRIALGFRLLARNLSVGFQMEQAQGRPEHIGEPLAFRALHVDALATFEQTTREIVLYRPTADEERLYTLSWTGCAIRAAA
jgi:hypothetical protein